MRTVTFSDARIVKFLNDHFVCAWVNRRPDLKFKDGLYANPWRPRRLPNGTAVTNVTSVFAAPDGTVLNAIPGYLDASAFLRNLKFAQSLNARCSDPAVRRDDRVRLYAEAHRLAASQSPHRTETSAHQRLAAEYMRVEVLPLDYFDGLGDEFS